jgi:hypothetical protein
VRRSVEFIQTRRRPLQSRPGDAERGLHRQASIAPTASQ